MKLGRLIAREEREAVRAHLSVEGRQQTLLHEVRQRGRAAGELSVDDRIAARFWIERGIQDDEIRVDLVEYRRGSGGRQSRDPKPRLLWLEVEVLQKEGLRELGADHASHFLERQFLGCPALLLGDRGVVVDLLAG